MKYKKIIIFLALIVLLQPVYSFAADTVCSNDPGISEKPALCNPLSTKSGNSVSTVNDLGAFAVKILGVFAGVAGIASIVYIVYAGFRFLISQGNEESAATAKRSLQWTISGFIVMLLAYVLVNATARFLNYQVPGYNPTDSTLHNPIGDAGTASTNAGQINNFNDLYQTILNGFFEIMGLIAVLILIFNGFRYITARGDAEQAETAKQGITFAVLGIAVALLGYVIIHAVAAFFGKS